MLSLPEDLQRAMDAPIPADGQIHVRRRGRFQISANTLFCAERNTFAVGVDTRPLSTREKCVVTTDHEDVPPQTVFMTGRQLPNREGRPYKLMLATWQGGAADGAYWIGSVERGPDRLHERGRALIGDIENPRAEPPIEARIRESIAGDSEDLSNAFISYSSRR